MQYIVYRQTEGSIAKVVTIYKNPYPELPDMHGPGLFVDSIPDPDGRDGFVSVLMVKLPDEGNNNEPELYYDYVAIPEPEETQLEKAQVRIATLEAADLDNKEMIATLYELTLMGGMS